MEDKKNPLSMNRRNFLKAGAVFGMGAAAVGLAGCASTKDSKNASSTSSTSQVQNISVSATETCDIVVCGAGSSGISAAVRAAEQGKKVVLLEKSSTIGGASLSVYSATVHQADDDITSEVNEWVADSHWRVDATVISNMLHASGEAFTWLRDTHGWEFVPKVSFGKPQWVLPGDSSARTSLYQKMIDKAGVDVRTGMTAKQLLQDASGKVTGVIALDSSGKGVQFDCGAVAVATGGYAGNAEMVKEAFGFEGICGGLPQNIGEGLEMMWTAGGKKPVNYGGQMLHQTLTPCLNQLSGEFDDFKAKYPFLTSYMPHFMNVTAKGRRFRNEGIITSADAAANSSAYQGAFHYVLVSQGQLDELAQGGLEAWGYTAKLPVPPKMAPKYDLNTPWEDASKVFDAMAQGGEGFRGATYEELAQAAGIESKTFVQTCENYEQYCKNAQDTELGKEAKYLRVMGKGPYYLIKTNQNNLTSWGGVATDIEYRVLNSGNDPIPGLYAIGVESGSNLYNDTYVGVGIGVCLVFTSGYLAAKHMVEYLNL